SARYSSRTTPSSAGSRRAQGRPQSPSVKATTSRGDQPSCAPRRSTAARSRARPTRGAGVATVGSAAIGAVLAAGAAGGREQAEELRPPAEAPAQVVQVAPVRQPEG